MQTRETVVVRFRTRDAASSGHDIEVNDAGTSLAVCIAMKNGSEFQYELPLYAAVLPQVQVAVEEYNVEVVLSKRDLVQWPSLEPAKKAMPAAVAAAGSAAPLAPTPVAPAAAAASSTAASEPAASAAAPPKAKAKNWDALEAELDSDEEEDKPQGEAALQALFRQIYEKADPDTRRAMVKSFQTSGGTVLSTNWGEVSAKNYEEERPAPDGATWKKYDK